LQHKKPTASLVLHKVVL